LSRAELTTPGELYEIRLDLRASSNYFAKDHKIRLEITSSNFPRWDRNLNTGGNNYDETEWLVASNKVYHAKDKLSYLILPVIKK
jgi:predicted acyl esterase